MNMTELRFLTVLGDSKRLFSISSVMDSLIYGQLIVDIRFCELFIVSPMWLRKYIEGKLFDPALFH